MSILKLPKPTSIASSLRHFYNTLMGDIRSLRALNIDVSACAPIVVPIIEEKLPGKILSSIGDCGTDADFKLDKFTENFKNYILRKEQAHSSNATWVQDAQPFLSYDMHKLPSALSTMVASTNNCSQLCNESRITQRCPLSAFEKQNIVLTNKLCLNCLHSGHRVSQCSTRGRCAKCKGKHRTAIRGIQIHRSTCVPTHVFGFHRAVIASSQCYTHAINVIAVNDCQLRITPMPLTSSQSMIANENVSSFATFPHVASTGEEFLKDLLEPPKPALKSARSLSSLIHRVIHTFKGNTNCS